MTKREVEKALKEIVHNSGLEIGEVRRIFYSKKPAERAGSIKPRVRTRGNGGRMSVSPCNGRQRCE